MIFADHGAEIKVFEVWDVFVVELENPPAEILQIDYDNALLAIFLG